MKKIAIEIFQPLHRNVIQTEDASNVSQSHLDGRTTLPRARTP